MNNYRISNMAIQDLNSIWYYTFEKGSKKQADKYYRELISEIKNVLRILLMEIQLHKSVLAIDHLK